jgi:hypothetical protein
LAQTPDAYYVGRSRGWAPLAGCTRGCFKARCPGSDGNRPASKQPTWRRWALVVCWLDGDHGTSWWPQQTRDDCNHRASLPFSWLHYRPGVAKPVRSRSAARTKHFSSSPAATNEWALGAGRLFAFCVGATSRARGESVASQAG